MIINQIKTIGLLGILSAILVIAGGAIAGETGLIMALLFAILMNGVSYFYSDKMALSANGAIKVERNQEPELYEIVENLVKKADLPMPNLYIIPQQQANAFATGRDPDHAAVAVTKGLMQYLNRDEIEAVLAHELGHIKNRDILIATIAAVLASVVSYIAQMAFFFAPSQDEDSPSPLVGLLMIIIAPIAATIIQLAISRQREFLADSTAAELVGSGKPLINALETIHDTVKRAPAQDMNPAFASMYIGNPLGNAGAWFSKLFSTHPPLEERVENLRKYA
jgi:heat shock protein HtpX